MRRVTASTVAERRAARRSAMSAAERKTAAWRTKIRGPGADGSVSRGVLAKHADVCLWCSLQIYSAVNAAMDQLKPRRMVVQACMPAMRNNIQLCVCVQ